MGETKSNTGGILPKPSMISNTTIVGVCVNVTLTNPLDPERMYQIIYSGFVYEPYRVLTTTAHNECEVSDALTLKQLKKYLDIKEEFNVDIFKKVIPSKTKDINI